MLRQLWRLTRPVPAAGPDALALTIYEHPDGVVHAAESGFEGVACVDDTARLLGVLCDVWEHTGLNWVERWARGTRDFVLWMQEPDGRWLNFIHDWEGDKNREGITSRPGQNFWTARAVHGLQAAAHAFDDQEARAAYMRGYAALDGEPAPPDIRALHLLVALADGDEPAIRSWTDELLACRDGAVLKNSPLEVGTPHLWAHIQEGVLAWSSAALDDPALFDAAAASAEALVVPAVERAFAHQVSTSAYDVASCAWSLDVLARGDDTSRWAALAADARAWFDGRNAAEQPVYDRKRGRVGDGVDEDRVSENSGAETNIVAAEVLLDDAVDAALAMPDPFED